MWSSSLAGREKKTVFFTGRGTIVLNLSGNGFRTVQARTCGRNLTCYNCFLIRAGGQVWDRRILQAVIFKTRHGWAADSCKTVEKSRKNTAWKWKKRGLKLDIPRGISYNFVIAERFSGRAFAAVSLNLD